MKMVGLFLLAVVLVVGALAPAAAHAQGTPVITFAAAETAARELFIRGSSFGTVPKVYLGATTGKMKPLVLLEKSATSIRARLSTITPGSYLLVVANGNLRGMATVSIGAVGPRGPAGPQGPPGIDGYPCWDDNGSGVCELDTEDLNKDGACSVSDCRMPILRWGAYYGASNLVGADFSHMKMAGSAFLGTDLRLANFTGADCTATIFESPNLLLANFTGANLSVSTFRGSFRNVDFSNANLSFADFMMADLTDAKFVGADVSNVRYGHFTMCPDGRNATRIHPGSLPNYYDYTCAGQGGGL